MPSKVPLSQQPLSPAAAKVLAALTKAGQPLRLMEIAHACKNTEAGVHTALVRRLLVRGLVKQIARGIYATREVAEKEAKKSKVRSAPVKGALYHDFTGDLRATMVDVRRFLPEYDVRNFRDLRSRGLIPVMEDRVERYLKAGGDFAKLTGFSGAAEASIRSKIFPSMRIIARVLGRAPKTDAEIMQEMLPEEALDAA